MPVRCRFLHVPTRLLPQRLLCLSLTEAINESSPCICISLEGDAMIVRALPVIHVKITEALSGGGVGGGTRVSGSWYPGSKRAQVRVSPGVGSTWGSPQVR